MAEVLDDVGVNGRRAVAGVRPPRQSGSRLSHVGHRRLRGWSGERGRLGRPVENDGRIGGRFDDESGTPRCLSRLAGRLARVPASVRLAKVWTTTRTAPTDVKLNNEK